VDLAPFLTFAGVVLTAIITLVGTVLVARSKTKTDIGQSITAGFQALTDQLQQERKELTEVIEKQRIKIDSQSEKIDFESRRGRRMEAHIEILESLLKLKKIEVPAREFSGD
jgi:hypothetical protein